MTEKELYLLTHPDEWPHEGLLPLNRRGENVIYITFRMPALLWKTTYAVYGRVFIWATLIHGTENPKITEVPSIYFPNGR
jgi:hypothetical protein